MVQAVKNLLLIQETWLWSLGQEDHLEKEIVTHSSILAWEIPWTEGFGGLPSMGLQRVGHDWATNPFTFFILLFIYVLFFRVNLLLRFVRGFVNQHKYYNHLFFLSLCKTCVCVHVQVCILYVYSFRTFINIQTIK